MVGLAVLLGIGIVAAHDKAVAGETRLLNAQNQIIKFKLGHNCQATTDGTTKKRADCMEDQTELSTTSRWPS